MATTEQNTTVKKQRSVIIIGAGWAGLAAAVKLIHAGYKVTLLESARQVGGRARRVAFNKLRVDNGQHLLIGAYQDTLELMSFLKIDPAEKLLRQSLSLTSYYKNGKSVSLSTANIIAPLHLFVGLLRAGGLSLRERVHALLFGRRLFMHGFKFKNDISVEAMMQRYKQPAGLCEKLWYPLCIAIMNTSPQLASAQIFLRVLFDSFKGSNESSDFLFTRDDLSSLLPDPAVEYIEKNGGSVKLGQRVTALDVNEHNSISVQVDEQDYHAEHVIIATTPHACNSLIMNIPALKQLAHDLSKFNYEPIVTVYLQYPEQTKLPQHMIGLIDCTTQWLFDRRIYDQPGLMAAVISSS
ncbi:MAG: hydroxysqualene dehydroxylase HpnE, partial [Gammaproteobacteria bacterium]|nr:hydroxysqualene dehydroxylase HpnE [Gammaproteobacteria bacterium]